MFILILGLLFALLVAVFAIQNAGLVIIQFLWIETQVPLVLVILGSAFAGALVTLLLALWREFRKKRKIKHASSKAPINPDKNSGLANGKVEAANGQTGKETNETQPASGQS